MAPYVPDDDEDYSEYDYSDQDWETEAADASINIENNPEHIPLGPSTFDALPFELISGIFMALSDSLPEIERAKAPGTLISVCRRFRDIAINSPGLWTNIVIPSLHLPIHHIPAYLERSKSLPLNVSIHLVPHGRAFDRRSTFHARVTSLDSELARWKSLGIIMEKPWKDLSSILPAILPNVENLWISSREHGTTILRNSFPRVTSLATDRVNIDWMETEFWNLRQLDITAAWWGDQNWGAFIIFLRHNHWLRRLSIAVHAMERTGLELPPYGWIDLPNLEELDLQIKVGGIFTSMFLNALRVPKLRALTLAGTGRSDQQIWDFEPTIFRFPDVQELALKNLRRVDDLLPFTLRGLPYITHLTIHNQPDLPDSIASLTSLHDTSVPFPCPHLTYLSTRWIRPSVVRQVLERKELASRRLTVWMHVDDIALPATDPLHAFIGLASTIDWLVQRTHFRTFGKGSPGRYRDWDAVQRRAWREHAAETPQWLSPIAE